MLDEATHPRSRDAASTENLHSITRRFLRRLCSVHLQQGNRSSKELRLLLVRLYSFFKRNVEVFELNGHTMLFI